jgi:hypothetical protein
MEAKVGDRLVIESNRVGQARKVAEVLEVRGPNGEPPYLVRWTDGHEGLMFPGPDAHIDHGH